jgi:hypothetical protein
MSAQAGALGVHRRAARGRGRNVHRLGAITFGDAPLLAVVAVIGTAIIYLRRPDAFLHPQFWAEDGTSFFSPAYNHSGLGFGLLLRQHAGYLAILNRGVALIAVHLPLSWAPSLFNGAGLICQLLPALILVSRRSESLISAQWIRVGVALFYFALPGTFEVDINLTNAQWHLALAAVLVLLARPAATRLGDVFDGVVVVLAGLTGPFAFLLLPIAVAVAVIHRRSRSYAMAGLVLVTFVCQLVCLINSPRSAPASLGANLNVLSRLIGGRVVLGPVLGGGGFVEAQGHVTSTAFWIACAIGGGLFVLAVLWRSTAELRLLVVFGLLCLAAGLLRPLSAGSDVWESFLATGGARYFFVPMFTMVVLVGAAMERPMLLLRIGAGLFVVASLLIGIRKDWTYPPYANTHYQRYVAAFQHLPKGRTLIMVENPGWKFPLIRR